MGSYYSKYRKWQLKCAVLNELQNKVLVSDTEPYDKDAPRNIIYVNEFINKHNGNCTFSVFFTNSDNVPSMLPMSGGVGARVGILKSSIDWGKYKEGDDESQNMWEYADIMAYESRQWLLSDDFDAMIDKILDRIAMFPLPVLRNKRLDDYQGFAGKYYYDRTDNIYVGKVVGEKSAGHFHGKTFKQLKKAFHQTVDHFESVNDLLKKEMLSLKLKER